MKCAHATLHPNFAQRREFRMRDKQKYPHKLCAAPSQPGFLLESCNLSDFYFSDFLMSHESALQSMRASLVQLEQKQTSVAEFCSFWRAQQSLLNDLPPRFSEVMDDLLSRLESGSLFTEESCSFSQTDLHAPLSMWLDKASERAQAK
jgi:hypothetical protein